MNEQNNEDSMAVGNRNTMFGRVERHVQSKTMSGLIELLPLLITILAAAFIIDNTDALVRRLPFVSGQPWDFPGIGFIAMVVIFYLIGLFISMRFGRKLMDWKGVAMNHIPFVRAIYGVTQQAVASMTSQYHFSRVVFVEWPREGMIAMGFVTGRAFSPSSKDSIVLVYIPTVPNPTSGNLALVLEDDVIETDLDVEDAMRLVFSGGIVLPDAISMARVPREQRTDFGLIGRFESGGSDLD